MPAASHGLVQVLLLDSVSPRLAAERITTTHAPALIVRAAVVTLLAVEIVALCLETAAAQADRLREFTITANECHFTPSHVKVDFGDRVRITVIAEDAPHGFVLKAYRIMKLAAPNRPAIVSFFASQRGTFVFYSNLTSDAVCVDMRGRLVVQ